MILMIMLLIYLIGLRMIRKNWHMKSISHHTQETYMKILMITFQKKVWLKLLIFVFKLIWDMAVEY